MSTNESDAGQSGAGRREVAWRVFAAEFDDADFSYAESDEERAPNYVVTPTGARINRLFVVGVLTEVEQVSDDVLRARVVDPTGAFVVYAGQYQPDALAALESAETPSFVAVTGKARTFEPDDADVVYTSIRPESINEVDAETRDRWTVRTAEQTLDRVAAFADALDREERGDDLRDALVAAGVRPDLAAGVPVAIDHYGTTKAYLAAVRDLAVDAARVVAGEQEAVDDLGVRPSEGGPVDEDLAGADIGEVAAEPSDVEPETTAGTSGTSGSESEAASGGASEPEEPAESASESEDSSLGGFEPATGPESESQSETSADESTSAAESERESGADEAVDEDEGEDEDEEVPEDVLSDEEREQIESEYGVDFSTGTDIPEGGEADIEPEADQPEPGDDSDVEAETETETAAGSPGSTGGEATASSDAASTEDEPAPDEATPGPEGADADLDGSLEDAVVDVMEELDDGDGADREELVETVVERYGVDREAVTDAVQDALMSGRCYESGDDTLKAI